MADPRVLVTGAPGWLGTRLVRALSQGFSGGPVKQEPEAVRVLSAPNVDLSPVQLEGVEAHSVDLTNPVLSDELFTGIDTVFHCAGVVHPHRVEDLYKLNVDGTRRLLNAAVRAKVRRFVFVSSNSPAGLNVDPARLMKEDDPPRPYLNYGLSKLQSEWLVLDAHRAGRIEGVILRPCWFYGPDQPHRQTRFFKMIQGGHPIVFGRGVEVTVTCDESGFEGAGAYLLGAVLEEFFSKYVSLNSFTQTVLRSTQRGEIKRWRVRSGRRQTL